MKLYVSVCHDRHVDDEIKVWSNAYRAINHAKSFMEEYTDAYGYKIEERDIEGWLYLSYCDLAESSAYVFETELEE